MMLFSNSSCSCSGESSIAVTVTVSSASSSGGVSIISETCSCFCSSFHGTGGSGVFVNWFIFSSNAFIVDSKCAIASLVA